MHQLSSWIFPSGSIDVVNGVQLISIDMAKLKSQFLFVLQYQVRNNNSVFLLEKNKQSYSASLNFN